MKAQSTRKQNENYIVGAVWGTGLSLALCHAIHERQQATIGQDLRCSHVCWPRYSKDVLLPDLTQWPCSLIPTETTTFKGRVKTFWEIQLFLSRVK